MKLQLAAMAALMLALGSGIPATGHAAGPRIDDRLRARRLGPQPRASAHRHPHSADGTVFTSVYWIDENGQWYLPAD